MIVGCLWEGRVVGSSVLLLLHSDVMRLRRSVQLVLILITCKKIKIHKTLKTKNSDIFENLLSLKRD